VNYTVLPGRLLVVRDPDISLMKLEAFGKAPVFLYAPDDMVTSNIHSWAAGDRQQCSGTCLLHVPSENWIHDPDLTNLRVYWEKFSERAFEVEGKAFHVIPERAVFSYEEIEE
jgi:hypothetical protein